MASRWASGGSRGRPRPVVERGRPGDQQEQAREAAGVHLVDQLPQRVERLVADVAADPLQRLHLVQHEQQPRWPASRSTSSSPCRKPSAPKWSSSPRIPALALGGGRDVRLAAEPGEQRVAPSPSSPARTAAGRRAAPGRTPGCVRETAASRCSSSRSTASPDAWPRPASDAGRLAVTSSSRVNSQASRTGAQRARRERRGAQRLADPPVDGLQLVQRRLGLGDLHLGGGEAAAAAPARRASG